MRIVITGASGNVGTSLLRRLRDGTGHDLVAVARRPPNGDEPYDAARWHALDVAGPDAVGKLTEVCTGADAVVHLAWQFQPSHRRGRVRDVGVRGTSAALTAAARAGVGQLVHMSSGAVYSAVDDNREVTESAARQGVATSAYSVDKVAAERVLDQFERARPEQGMQIARLRPGFIGQRAAGGELLRYAMPGFLPARVLDRWPVLPLDTSLCIPAVHSDDVAEAIVAVLDRRAHGPFNIAAPPPVCARDMAEALGMRLVHVRRSWLRTAVQASWRARLQPVDAGWIDLAYGVPQLDCTRAREELGWTPRRTGIEAVTETVAGLLHGGSGDSPVLRERDVDAEAGKVLRGDTVATRDQA